MKVKDLMSAEPRTCTPQTSAAEAAHLMWEGDCGFLPVVEGNAPIGVVTDRDLFIALATRNRLATGLAVGDVCSGTVFTCAPDDSITQALHVMRQHGVRRLPVVEQDRLVGVISMDDILCAAGAHGPIRARDVVDAMQAISPRHRHAALTI